ncbi:MAG: hypothetical protein IJE43_19200 [Alphaproteobacteria bacterium]|nr:hypothetical protein [Alphaproteobacteria bacterium]
MIVGTSNVIKSEMAKHVKSLTDFKQYCKSLVPEEFRHIDAIVNNQQYLCCLVLRKDNNVSWSIKKDLIDAVMRETKIVGCTNELINIADILFFLERDI